MYEQLKSLLSCSSPKQAVSCEMGELDQFADPLLDLEHLTSRSQLCLLAIRRCLTGAREGMSYSSG